MFAQSRSKHVSLGGHLNWDTFGRLTKVYQGTDSDTSHDALVATYRYDAFNRRVERTLYQTPSTGDLVTRFIYDGWRAIEERGVTGTSPGQSETVRARYGFGVALDEVVWMDRDMTSAADATPNGSIDSRYYLSQDALGSVAAATILPTDRDGIPGGTFQVAEHYTYSAYGQVTAWTGPWVTTPPGYSGGHNYSTIGLPYLFTGQRLDAESGLYYFKNRPVDPTNGRFLRRDLIGMADSVNIYEYGRSRPSTLTDRLGLASDQYLAGTGWAENRMAQLLRGGPGYSLDNFYTVSGCSPCGTRPDFESDDTGDATGGGATPGDGSALGNADQTWPEVTSGASADDTTPKSAAQRFVGIFAGTVDVTATGYKIRNAAEGPSVSIGSLTVRFPTDDLLDRWTRLLMRSLAKSTHFARRMKGLITDQKNKVVITLVDNDPSFRIDTPSPLPSEDTHDHTSFFYVDVADLEGLPNDRTSGASILLADTVAHIFGEALYMADRNVPRTEAAHARGLAWENDVRMELNLTLIDHQEGTPADRPGLGMMIFTFVTGSTITVYTYGGWIDPSGWR